MREKYKYENNDFLVNINKEWIKVPFSGYEFIEEIASGANGIVVKARHNITQRTDAIKVWLPHNHSKNGKVSEEQYLNEIRKVANLKNGNIVTIYDAKIIDNKVYMAAMEYIEGKPLKKWINNYHPINIRIEVCEKILNTVLAYQSKGIIHGDLHGGNIIIDKNNDIHIIDFGTSLFGHINQSKERESYFLVDLVKKLLREHFIKGCFSFENYNIRDAIYNENDSRNYNPILITKTLIKYLELVKIKVIAKSLNDNNVLYQYCYNISQGIYFNLDGVYKEMLTWNNSKIGPAFSQVLYENINGTIFDVKNHKEMEDIFYSTLYIYYEMFKEIKDRVDFNKTQEQYLLHYHNEVDSFKYQEYITKLNCFGRGSYIDYHNKLINEVLDCDEVSNIDNINREILADLLKTFYDSRFIITLYELWQKLNVIWLDEALHNDIFKLSNIAQFNGWITE